MLQDSWAKNNRETITMLTINLHNLTGLPLSHFENQNVIRPVLSQAIGDNNCSAFLPNRDIDFNEINHEYNILLGKLRSSKPRCCMTFFPTEPFNSVDVRGTILKHGICSN